jgi:hypothetical protein
MTTFCIYYLSINVAAMLPGKDHLAASVKTVLKSFSTENDPMEISRYISGFYEDPDTQRIWIPASAIIRIERMVQ